MQREIAIRYPSQMVFPLVCFTQLFRPTFSKNVLNITLGQRRLNILMIKELEHLTHEERTSKLEFFGLKKVAQERSDQCV